MNDIGHIALIILACWAFMALLPHRSVNPHPTEFWQYPQVMADVRRHMEGR